MSGSGTPFAVVDVFADGPFRGVPVVVVRAPAARGGTWAAAVAGEFAGWCVVVEGPGPSGEAVVWSCRSDGALRPAGPVALAAAAALSGALVVRADEAACAVSQRDGRVELMVETATATPVPHDRTLGHALGVTEIYGVARVGDDLVVELADADAVAAVRADRAVIAALGYRRVVVSAPGGATDDGPGIDVMARVARPDLVREPVVDGALAGLAAFWFDRTGRSDLVVADAGPRHARGIVRATSGGLAVSGRVERIALGTIG